MKLKLLRNIGKKDTLPRNSDNPNSLELPCKPDGSLYQEGEVAEFSKEDGEKLVKHGLGEETTDPVGPAPKQQVFGQTPVPVTIVDNTNKPHRADPPENAPGNKK